MEQLDGKSISLTTGTHEVVTGEVSKFVYALNVECAGLMQGVQVVADVTEDGDNEVCRILCHGCVY